MLHEYAPFIASACFLGFSVGYRIGYRDAHPARVPLSAEFLARFDATVQAEYDHLLYPYLYMNADALYVDGMVPLFSRPSKSPEQIGQEICWLGFVVGYNEYRADLQNPAHEGSWRQRGKGLPPPDVKLAELARARFEEAWDASREAESTSNYGDAMAAAQEDASIPRLAVLGHTCRASFVAGFVACRLTLGAEHRDATPAMIEDSEAIAAEE